MFGSFLHCLYRSRFHRRYFLLVIQLYSGPEPWTTFSCSCRQTLRSSLPNSSLCHKANTFNYWTSFNWKLSIIKWPKLFWHTVDLGAGLAHKLPADCCAVINPVVHLSSTLSNKYSNKYNNHVTEIRSCYTFSSNLISPKDLKHSRHHDHKSNWNTSEDKMMLMSVFSGQKQLLGPTSAETVTGTQLPLGWMLVLFLQNFIFDREK